MGAAAGAVPGLQFAEIGGHAYAPQLRVGRDFRALLIRQGDAGRLLLFGRGDFAAHGEPLLVTP